VKLTTFTLDPQDVGKQNRPHKATCISRWTVARTSTRSPSGANGQLAVKLGIAGKYSRSVTPSITYKHLPKAKHHLDVFLPNNDHSPVGPKAAVSFTVR
jgi:hypothetical protein